MPAVTLLSKPKGEPIASHPFADLEQSKDHRCARSAEFGAVDLDQGDVGALVDAEHACLEFALVAQLDS
jgi:hypothetical protein